MANTGENRRVRYTKQVLRETFLELLLEKPASEITVTEICAKADVNRTTFYLHYDDVFDLLHKIEDTFFDAMVSAIDHYYGNGGRYASMVPVYETVAENGMLCEALFGKFGDDTFLKCCCEIQKDKMVTFLKQTYPNESNQTLESMRCYVMNGCMGVIKNWVYSGMQGNPVQLAKLADRLSAQALGLR